MEALQAGDPVIVFPDVDYTDRSGDMGEMYDGFLAVGGEHVAAPAAKVAGKHVGDVPLVVSNEELIGHGNPLLSLHPSPFRPRSSASRTEAHLRRDSRRAAPARLRFDGDLVINYSDRTLRFQGREIPLAKKEFDILAFLSQNPGLVFDKDRIYERVWSYDSEGDSSVVAEHIRRAAAPAPRPPRPAPAAGPARRRRRSWPPRHSGLSLPESGAGV